MFVVVVGVAVVDAGSAVYGIDENEVSEKEETSNGSQAGGYRAVAYKIEF